MKITLPKIKVKKEDEKSGIFVISPLFPGYGVTIGNSLRRILLSSLGGGAIYEVKIDGATHEFSSIDGVKEDLIEIILALKRVRFKLHEEKASLTLDVKGPKDVTAKDIKTPSAVEIVNKDLPIASLNKKAKLKIEMKVKKGIGYQPSEERKDEERAIGAVAMDAVFTPVEKVNYKTEFTRVGKVTNYDKLTLEIETDGTVTPKEAIQQAAEILEKHFSLIKEFKSEVKEIEAEPRKRIDDKAKSKAKKSETKDTRPAKEDTDHKKLAIEEAGFSPRTVKSLIDNKIKTVAGLNRLSDEKIKEIKGLGEKSFQEIQRKLKRWGLR